MLTAWVPRHINTDDLRITDLRLRIEHACVKRQNSGRPRGAARSYGTQTYGTEIPEVRARAAARGPARSIQPGHIEFGTGDWSL